MGSRQGPLYLFAVLVLLHVHEHGALREEVCSTTSNQAVIQPDADAFIAGFFAMRNAGDNGVGCGAIRTSEMQSYEVIRWALDRLNKKDEMLNGEYLTDYFIPGVRIGMIAHDYCSNPLMAIRQAASMFPPTGASDVECTRNTDTLMLGMVGASSSDDTKALQNYASDNSLPLVSYYATAPELSHTENYQYFMRTIPPDGPLTRTIVDFLGELNWKYVVVVYTDNSYGRGAYHAIRPHLANAGICLTAALAADPTDDSDTTIDDKLRTIMQTNTTGVIYLGNSMLINAFLERGELKDGAGKLQWVVTDSVSLSDKFPGQKYPRGLISVVPAGRKIIEFEDHWVRIDPTNPSVENPWFKEMYMERFKCRLPGMTSNNPDCVMNTETTRRNDFVQDQFVEPAVHAVFTYARALKNAHQDLCGGTPGMCSQLRLLSTSAFYNGYMRNLDFMYGKQERVESLASFSLDPYNSAARVAYEENDITEPSFEVFNFNDYPFGDSYKFQSVGTYIRNLLEIITARLRFYDEPRDNVLAYTPQSSCPSDPCSPCLGAIPESKYVYIPGDVVINAAFSVHWPGMEPLSCGMFDGSYTQGIQRMQALIYTVNFINNEWAGSRGKLTNVKLGALGFDDCMNPILANQQITEVQRYSKTIVDDDGLNPLDPRKVEAFMTGGIDPWLGEAMASLMNTMKRPVVEAEITTLLNDEEMFPYFIRANYDIEYIARAFINIAKQQKWDYIQVLHHEGYWGEETNTILTKIAAEEGICVVASFAVRDYNGVEIVEGLRVRSDVQPVVVLLMHSEFRMFLDGLKMHNSTNEFQILSVTGNSMSAIAGYEEFVGEMISIQQWNGPKVNDFKSHLQQIDPATYMTNPWMQEWYENYMDCSFMPTDGQTQCGTTNMFGQNIFTYELDADVVSIIYGVMAIAQGLDETLLHYCGSGYSGLCGNFLNAQDKGMVLRNKILEETSYAPGLYEYRFNDQRMGAIPFTYHNFRPQFNSFTDIGRYSPIDDTLELRETDYQLIAGGVESSCPGVCMECLYLFGYQKYMYIDGDLIIPGIFDVHYRGDSPYSCSDLRVQNGFQYTEAFRYALDRINRGVADVKLNGVTLGGLGFDGCTDNIRASAIVTGIYSGAFPRPGTDLGKQGVDTGELQGWLSYDSESTVSIAKILQRQNVPAITPGATTPLLDDKDEFYTFFRTIPSDSMVAMAMAKLSYTLGFKYIITLNAPEDGSRDAVAKFREYAEDIGICIAASYEFDTDGDVGQMMQYILQSTTKVVAVFASPDQYIEDLIQLKMLMGTAGNIPEVNDIIFITNQPWTNAVQNVKPIGESPVPSTISFKMDGDITLDEFLFFLSDESRSLGGHHPNPWWREFYETVKECAFAGSYMYNTSCGSFDTLRIDPNQLQQDIRVIPTMNAVYSLAEGIHRTLVEKCGPTYNGVCPDFLNDEDTHSRIMAHMDLMSYQDIAGAMYQFLEREADRHLTFWQFQNDGTEEQIGTFYDEVLNIPNEDNLQLTYAQVPSTCEGQCAQCQQESTGAEEFMFIAGEIIIAGLFDVHKEGSTPYTCGEINDMHGFQLMEAFNWAMDYVNRGQGIFYRKLQGVKLGSLIFDTCHSAVRAGNLIANYHARNFEIRTTDYRIDPRLIDLYIGPFTSEATIRVADVLRELGIPQIGYGASSLELNDQRKYQYFMRTVPGDDKQARALISILKKYDFDNIQLISQNSSVGEYATEEFLRLAPLNKICVTAQYIIGQDGMVSPDDSAVVINKLRDHPDAKVVVIIMDDPYTVLKVANMMLNYTQAIDNFAFITTDKFGFGINGYSNMEEIGNLVRLKRIISLEVESADYPELDAYLEDKTPENYVSNPWFQEYYEFVHNCSLSAPNEQYPVICNDVLGYSRAESYIQDPYALYVINAVFSAALGIHQTLYEWCGGDQYNTVCSILRNNGEKRELIMANIRKAEFTDRTGQPFYFTEDGNSDRGYHVYEPQALQRSLHAGSDLYYWEDIGSYNDSHFLKMDVQYFPGWQSSCDISGSCQCVFPEYQPSRYMKKPEDINIVFISDIHDSDPDNELACGPLDTGSNMHTLLAFLYALEQVNANIDNKFQASLKLGGVALDTCSMPSRIGQDVYSLLSGEPICGELDGIQVVPASSIVTYMVRNSQNSIATSSMLSPLKITSLSMSATSVELNDKLEHAYFLRTVPPDNIQALIVAQLLRKFSWDYVSVVYVENTYGRSARETLLSQTDPNNPQFCFGKTVPMALDADLADAKVVIDKLNQQIGAKVVVTFVTSEQNRLLLQATTEKGLNHKFIWIGSDTWASNTDITTGYEETAAGALTIQIRSEFSNGFRDFMKSITFNDRKGLPNDWFEEFYQTVHQCRILGSVIQKSYTTICSGDEVFTDDMITQDPYVLHTIIAVYQIANGLNQIEACRQSSSIGIASCLSTLENRKETIYDSILDAEHDVLPNDLGSNSFAFKFTPEGYGDIGYTVFNFRRNLTSGRHEYIKIGSSSGDLRLDVRDYQSYSFTDRSLPLSRCEIGSTCQCEDVDGGTFKFSRQESGYIVTDEGQYLDPTTGQLVTIKDTPEIADRFRDIWAIIVATLAALGAFATLCMFIYLLVMYPVRGGTSILGYMLCFGIILMYCMVFAFIIHANQQICGLRRFCLGFVYSITYAALFVKLVDCWRTKDKDDIYLVKYSKIGNPWGLFFSACLLVLVQVMINAEWLILEGPAMERVIYNNMLWPRCVPDDFYDEGLILSNVYVMFIIFLSVIVGLFAFGNDKNHWDCRWLTGCVVLTIPAWMVWCLVAALGEYKMRDAAVAIGLLYNATVMLFCGPLRKLYLLNNYQASIEEEEQKSLAMSGQRDINSMYGQQYDNMPRMHDGDSVRGSSMERDDVFMYEPKS